MELRRQIAHIAHGTKGERSTDHGRQGEDRRNRLAHPGGAPEERAHELRRARPPGRPVRPGGSRACEAAGGPGRADRLFSPCRPKSEERREGKSGVSTCSTRWLTYTNTTINITITQHTSD